MKTLKNFSVKGKNILLRVDLNVPILDGIVTDHIKILDIKPTVDLLRSKKNKIFLISHFRRPKGKFVKKYSIKFLRENLIKILSIDKIYFAASCNEDDINKQKKIMQPGEVCLLENIRFHEGEEKNDIKFSKSLAKNFDVYINDAFSASHRNHASIVGITNYLPSLAGFFLVDEIGKLNKLLNNPIKPATLIIGGSKVSTKLKLLNNLVKIFDTIIIGGAMANTFMLSQGINTGKSLVEEELITDAKNILNKSKNFNTKIILPVDVVCAQGLEDTTNIKNVGIKNILAHQMILDIGDNTIQLIKSAILQSKLILWNGPLGAFEHVPFNYGTNKIAEVVKTDVQKLNIITFAVGSDTIAAIKKTKAEKYFSYLSTAGGACLGWLEGKESPGIKALRRNNFF